MHCSADSHAENCLERIIRCVLNHFVDHILDSTRHHGLLQVPYSFRVPEKNDQRAIESL